MVKQKRVGILTKTGGSDYDSEYPIWASIWRTDDERTCMSMFFTQKVNPKSDAWFRSLMDRIQTGTWRILMKGAFKYGFYFKTVGTTSVENGKKMFNEMNGWEFKTPDEVTYKIEITKDFDTFNSEMLAHMV